MAVFEERPETARARMLYQALLAVHSHLEALKGHLLAHLEYEETNVAVTARRLHDFP